MRALAIAVAVVSLVLTVVAMWLGWLTIDTSKPADMTTGSGILDVLTPLIGIAFVALGAVVARRLPRHPVAWCFLWVGLVIELFFTFLSYANYGLITAPGRVPGAEAARSLTGWFWPLPSTGLWLAVLLFPDGRPPSARWWAVAWLAVGAVVVNIVGDALGLTETHLSGLMFTVFFVGAPLLAVASMIVRFRRSRGVERLQLKWFAYSAAMGLTVSTVVGASPITNPIVSAAGVVSVLFIPVGAALAILRYRLYDIELVIERTLVYGAVTVTLGATYVATVVVLQGLLRPLTGGSEVAVALSTLLVVALFQPIRRRAQDAVDRRFYRARYDAARTVNAFVTRLRDEVELDSVRADLLEVVNSTVHPAHASIWLRGER